MGHFGLRPISRMWFLLVLPCLTLNYFGQGSLLLDHPEAISNPFYELAPRWFLYPSIVMATFATVIASQAVISGVFSLTRQAMQLGYAPRFKVVQTSSHEIGQVYLPQLNVMLFLATIYLVITFQTSSNLAAAYVVAFAATMTYVLAFADLHWMILLGLVLSTHEVFVSIRVVVFLHFFIIM